MIWLYRILFAPLMLLASPYYVRRMLRRGGYGENFAQRFGATPLLPSKKPGVKRIWLQAVSVGEMLAIGPVIEGLRQRGDVEIYLSTTTSTGYREGLKRYADRTLAVAYFPIDWWPFARRAWGKVNPDLVVLAEGERWPEHIRQAESRGVPVVCINARMSDRGHRRMLRFRSAVLSLFHGVSLWLPCSGQDAERLLEIGFPRERVRRTGNIKLDITIPPMSETEKLALRHELGLEEGLLLLGSSTWPGEEAALIEAYRTLRAEGVVAGLLLVPRHAERRGELADLLGGSGLTHHFRSRGAATCPVDICVADTTGELRRLTQLGDVVFVGKSLPPHHEGQTPVEAAAIGKPILFGPEMGNFREIARALTDADGALTVCDAEELRETVLELMKDEKRRIRMANASRTWLSANQGALQRTLEALNGLLG